MALIRVNAGDRVPPDLWRLAAALPVDAPIIVMIHGYRFSPYGDREDPHRHILSMNPAQQTRHVLSWPRALGFDETGTEGLAIAFGWEARGGLRAAYDRAHDVAAELGQVIDILFAMTGRPIAMIAHSLGARVALDCLHSAPRGSVGRLILLAGAEFRGAAANAVSTQTGNAAEVINITSRENDLFDFGFEMLLSGGRQQSLGFGLARPLPNWVDIQIDDPATLGALKGLGFPMEPRALRMCHWSPYMRKGVFDFYRTALRQPWALPLPQLRMRLPARPAPRWSRLLSLGHDADSGGLRA